MNKVLRLYQRTILTQKHKLLEEILGYDLYYSLTKTNRSLMSIKEKDKLFARILTLHYKMQQSSSVVLPSLIPETPMIGNLEDLHKILKIESQN